MVAQLGGLGLEAFLPRIQMRRKRHGHGTLQIEPLFPSYVFFAADLTGQVWNSIRWTRGVKAILGCDGVPSAVADEPIAMIMRQAGVDGVIRPKAPFALGDRVLVTDGPFVGLQGILERGASRSGRVKVLFEMLQGAKVELEDVNLELAS